MAWPVVSSGAPTTAASEQIGFLTMALSISAVPRRCPETLMTSKEIIEFGPLSPVTNRIKKGILRKDTIHPTLDPVIAIRVSHGSISSEKEPSEGFQVGLQIPLMVAMNCPFLLLFLLLLSFAFGICIAEDQERRRRKKIEKHRQPCNRRPRAPKAENPLNIISLQNSAGGRINNDRLQAEKGKRARARLGRGSARKGREHQAPCFRLPEGVNQGTLGIADHLVEPLPGFRVDGLPNRPQDPEGGAIVVGHVIVSEPFERSNRCRCCVQLGHLQPLDYLPFLF